MYYFKKIGFSLLYIVISILALTFIFTILNYFSIISDKLISIFKMFIPIISLFIGGLYLGKNSKGKIFFEGLKLGLIFSILIILINLIILSSPFKIKFTLLYLILIFSSILGSLFGFNKKK